MTVSRIATTAATISKALDTKPSKMLRNSNSHNANDMFGNAFAFYELPN